MIDIKTVLDDMSCFFDSNRTKSIHFRIDSLKALKASIIKHEESVYSALFADLGKHKFEAYATEVGMVLSEISYAIKHIKKWTKPRKVKTPLMHFLSRSKIYAEPYGKVLIISPWNYPFQLTLAPLVGAIAAGNCAIVKPSSLCLNTQAVISKILSDAFAPNYIKALHSEDIDTKTLLSHKFDYIFFTGGPKNGLSVMKSAANNLTPVTLELGGKSPCIVDENADINLAAKRIAWGKFLNAGQTCVAPDYLWVHKNVKEKFLSSLQIYIKKFYGDSPETNPDYPKIINRQYFERLKGFLKSGTVFFGGAVNDTSNKISPTILTDLDFSQTIMNEEIFGPILPIMEFDNLNDVISHIKDGEKPLALYLFTKNKAVENKIISEISFGGGCINDTVIHLATPHMPFGGVGNSGVGGYHGKFGFETFSHYKSILKKSNKLDINIRYAPYKRNVKTIKFFLK